MSDNKNQILSLILNSDSHLTADEIYCRLRSSGRHITLATVYNNLHSLCQEGKIRQITIDAKVERYDKPERHDHLICRHCGKISDIAMKDITDVLEESSGIKFDYYDLKLFYCCEQCRNKEHASMSTDSEHSR